MDREHNLPKPGEAQQEHVSSRRPFMDVQGEDQLSALDGAGVGQCRWYPSPAAPSRHDQLRETARSQGHVTQRDPGTSGAVSGSSICPGSNRGAEVPTTGAPHVMAGHQKLHPLCTSVSSVLRGPLFTQRYAPSVVHCQLGYSGELRAGAE